MSSPTRATGGPPDRSSRWRIPLPHSPAAVPLARETIRDILVGLGQADGPETDTAELLTAEVVTNAVEHTPGGPIELSVELLPQGFQVEVHDPGQEVPDGFTRLIPVQSAVPGDVPLAELAEGGRGLLLVRALSVSSGCRLTGTGKAVWFTLP
ncbi:ATP-binding protein [Actinacidiphila sp. ITFR-21]|uniref:ATP-binding protein n=1 Tax=Actinacidiphila sp. ITFR-21 TaxID=3075199 RepID=UPI00288A9D21|nr:ATP-binding protein [Streptomyces sp. ITFR-21]WNI18459.1 ATP-binding protein [Streptomyces sp. ITFR-21]